MLHNPRAGVSLSIEYRFLPSIYTTFCLFVFLFSFAVTMAASHSSLVLLTIAVIFSSVPNAVAESCPAFSKVEGGCSTQTCGHFVFKGAFSPSLEKQHTLTSFADGMTAVSTAACCQLCRLAEGCVFWSFLASASKCKLFGASLCLSADAYDSSVPDSYVGGNCQAVEETPVATNPADGAAQELLPEKAFCLVSDTDLHINMLLGGYYDSRTVGAKAVKKGRAVRSWIKDVSFMWTLNGKSHTLHLSSRRGPEQERGDGYMGFIKVDGTLIPRLSLGDEVNLFDGQAVVSFEAYEKTGPYDSDVFKVRIEGLLEAELRLRIAHPLLQMDNDAEVHMNMDILDLEYTPSIHGVLGQTYRADSSEQTLNYATLSELVYGSSNEGASDSITTISGTAAGYVASGITTPDCPISQFVRKKSQPKQSSETVATL